MVLEASHADDANPARAAAKVLDAIDPVYFARWPKEVALRFARGMGVISKVGESKKAAAALANSAPLGPKEPAAILEHALVAFGHGYPFQFEALVYALEELAGNEAALAALVAAFEALAAAAKKNQGRYESAYAQEGAAIAAGFLLLRADAEAAKAARARLAAIADVRSESPPLARLDMVLRGKDALAASDYSWTPPAVWLFSDDAKFVVDAIRSAKGQVEFDARAVWLGGDAVLPLYAKNVKKTPKAAVQFVADSVAMFQGEDAEALAAILEAKGATKKDAAAKAAPEPAKRMTPAAIEAAFDALVTDLVVAITDVRGQARQEAVALRAAAERYANLRGEWDTDTTAYLIHFFSADGVALEQSRVTAWAQLKPTAAESKRWLAVLTRCE
jgi:hypothetical protein